MRACGGGTLLESGMPSNASIKKHMLTFLLDVYIFEYCNSLHTCIFCAGIPVFSMGIHDCMPHSGWVFGYISGDFFFDLGVAAVL